MKFASFLTALRDPRREIGVALILLCLGAPSVRAGEFEDLERIRRAAEDYALAQLQGRALADIEARANNLDPRLRLARCGKPLEAFSTATASVGRMTVGVRCSADSPWTLYVPVNIEATAEAVISRRPLTRGEVLGQADLEVVRRPVSRLPNNYLRGSGEVLGMEVTRPLPSGTVLTVSMLGKPQLVRRGQEVVILARSGEIEVRMRGVALGDGASGELIDVRNSNSGRTVEARVTSASTVEVGM